MSLRPLPDLSNKDNLAKLGALSALRNARADALHQLRDSCVRLQNASSIDSVEIASCEEALQRLKEIDVLYAQVATHPA